MNYMYIVYGKFYLIWNYRYGVLSAFELLYVHVLMLYMVNVR